MLMVEACSFRLNAKVTGFGRLISALTLHTLSNCHVKSLCKARPVAVFPSVSFLEKCSSLVLSVCSELSEIGHALLVF